MKEKILLLAVAVLLAGCGRTVITNTHKGKYTSSQYVNNSVRPAAQTQSYTSSPIVNRVKIVALEPQPKEKPEKPLSPDKYTESVAKEIVKAYARHAGNGPEFVKLMKEALSVVEKEDRQQTDYSKITIRLNLTFVNEFLKNTDLHNPNTRIEYLNTTLTTVNNNVVFYDVDKFQNVVKLVDVGTLGRSQNVKFGAELNGSYGAGIENTSGTSNGSTLTGTQGNVQNVYDANNNLLGTISNGLTDAGTSGSTTGGKTTLGLTAAGKANYENATAITENANLKHDILSSGYSFDDTHLTVMKRGFPLNDIPNETFVTTTLKFRNSIGNTASVPSTVFTGRSLLTSAGLPTKADEAIFKSRTISYNKCGDGNKKIVLSVSYDGMIREVANKRENNKGEYDDVVEYRTFENINIPNIELDLNDYCSKVYRIKIIDGKKVYTLYIKPAAEAAMEMRFFQDDNYQEFITWLNRLTTTTDFKDLKTAKYSLSFSCLDNSFDTATCSDVEVISDVMDTAKLTSLKAFLKNKKIIAEEIP